VLRKSRVTCTLLHESPSILQPVQSARKFDALGDAGMARRLLATSRSRPGNRHEIEPMSLSRRCHSVAGGISATARIHIDSLGGVCYCCQTVLAGNSVINASVYFSRSAEHGPEFGHLQTWLPAWYLTKASA
jgi:hypothetical protein